MSLFKRIPITPKETKLSVEMIDVQTNDYIVPIMEKTVAKIREAFIEYNINSTREFYNNKVGYKHIEILDNALFKRFGIKTKHISANNSNYSVLTAPPKSYNVINGTVIDLYTDIDRYMKNSKRNESEVKHDYQYEDILLDWKKSIDSLEKALDTKGVIIDSHKAVILGLPSDYFVYIMGDIHYLINDANMTDREIVAIILHEIGHAFTHIEYSYRSVKNTAVLVDTLKDNLLNKNRSAKESLIIAYETAFHEKLTKDDTKNLVSAFIAIANKYTYNSEYMSYSRYASVDSEQLADQFAGRFGLGAELANSLNILIKNGEGLFSQFDFVSIIVIMHLALIALYLGVIGTLIIAVGYIVVYAILKLIMAVLTDGGGSAIQTYDDCKRRIVRIKNESIRQLRLVDLPKVEIENLIANIDTMSKLIDSIPEENQEIFNKLYTFFSKNAKIAQQTRYIEKALEDLMENDLHVSAAKITLLKDMK